MRLFLGGFDLTPSYKDVYNKFSVSYILNLILVDEDDRRYFKQREIVLWRKPEPNKLKGSTDSDTAVIEPTFVQVEPTREES